MAKRKKKNYKKKGKNDNTTVLQRSRDNNAKGLLDIMLVEEDKLNGKEYDFSIIPNIYALLYGLDSKIIYEHCKDAIDSSMEIRNYRSQKVEQYFKSNKIEHFFSNIVGNMIPERFKGIDKRTKLKSYKTLLGYYLLKVPNTASTDLCVSAIFKSLEDGFDKYIYRESESKRIELENVVIESLSKEKANLDSKVFVERNKVNYLEDLVPFYNNFIEGYIDYRDTSDASNINLAVDKVSKGNQAIFKILYNIGYEDVTEIELDEIAQKNLPEEVYEQYKKSVIEVNKIYYQVVMPLSYYMAEKELESLLKEERLSTNEELKNIKGLNSNLTSENKSANREINKLEKELEKLKSELENKSNEIFNLSQSKCDDLKYQSVLKELEMIKLENKNLTEKVVKWKCKCDSSQKRILVLEERVEDYNSLMDNLVELQQENILLQDAIEKVEDLTNYVGKTGTTYEEMLDAVKDLKILFIGGTSNVGTRLKETFNNLDFIDISDRTFNFVIPETTDCVVLYPKVITHAHTERVYSLINENTPIIYVNALNTQLVVKEIYNQFIDGHK